MLHRARRPGLLLPLLRARKESLHFLAANWHLGQHQQEETGVYIQIGAPSTLPNEVDRVTQRLSTYVRVMHVQYVIATLY